jgi:tetratricopeptide (TPR) repeat protein/TolB-like protein/predicted Ser/Thr protein kinase
MNDNFMSHYRILGKIGAGGMGVVYRAEDTKLGRTVALKFIQPQEIESAEEKARFLHEAQAAASLGHPNICVVHEIDEADGRLFMAMEYVEGESLRDRIARGPLRIDDAIDIAVQIAQGLDAAHRKNVVHRDVKPANIMIADGGLVKIMDFGLAKMSGRSRLTRTGTTLGTTAYMSPEQARGEEADRRSDIWSLGAVIYEMVAGRTPFKGDYEQAVLYAIMNEPPEPLTAVRAGVPMELERIVAKSLAKNPSERYQHADELAADLRALKKGLEAGAAPRSAAVSTARQGAASEPVGTPAKRRLAKAIVPICIAAAAVAAFILLRPVLFGGAIATARRPVAVITFENQTGDPQYDNLKQVIPSLLITSLEQSKYLQVVTRERLRDVLKEMGSGDVDDIDADLGFEICRREGIGTIVTGSFVKLGNNFVTDVKVLKVKSKDLVTSGTAEGRGVESIPEQVDKLSREIARGIGLSEPEIDATQHPVADWTTSSMEAYTWYIKGRDALQKVYNIEALRDFEKAIEFDSTFAAAYLLLGDVYSTLYSRDQSNWAYAKALAHSEKATERERLYIRARCAYKIDGDSEKAIDIYRELVERYPKDKAAYYYLGDLYRITGHYDDAVRILDRALELDPSFGTAINTLAYVYLNKGEYAKALPLFQKYASLFPEDANPLDSTAETYFLMGKLDESIAMYAKVCEMKPDFGAAMKVAYIYGVKGEYPKALEWIDRDIAAASRPGILISSRSWKAVFLFFSGRRNRAMLEIDRARAIADSTDNTGMLALTNVIAALMHLYRGEPAPAQSRFEEALKYQSPPYRLAAPDNSSLIAFFRGYCASRAGDLSLAEKSLAEMESLMPEVKKKTPGALIFIESRLALLAAELSLAEGHPDRAIKKWKKDFRIQAPGGTSGSLYAANMPFEQDVLAQAYAAKGDTRKAIAEYEKLLTFDPSSEDRRLKNPIYEYRLAKLLEKSGNRPGALEHYERFLGYWKNADPDIPELIDAKARVAALGRSSGNA